MTPRHVVAALLLLPAVLVARDHTAISQRAQSARGTQPAREADPGRARIAAGAAKLYDTSVLHRIDIVIAAEDVNKIPRRTTERVRCTFTIDGLTLQDVGVRQAGGVYHPYQPISNKPSLSLKFDEFVKGQRVFNLDKLILKNELQDRSLVNEHMSYEVLRRAGLAAPMTAHARVTINGIDNGIYLMREPVDKEFLTRNFGTSYKDGNLYEIENVREFVSDPGYPALDDEGKDGRNRNDLVRFAEAIRAATPDTFVSILSPMLDIDRFATFIAAETAIGHWDGFVYKNNNTYIYAHPKDGKYVFIPYGTDQAFAALGTSSFGGTPRALSYLAQKFLAVPVLAERVRSEFDRITREPVWNQQVLMDRLDRAGRVLATADTTGRTASDVERFVSLRPAIERIIRSGGPAIR